MTKEYEEYRKLIAHKKYQAAFSLAENEYLKKPDTNEFWLTQQTNALLYMKKYDQALKIAKQALQINIKNPYALLSAADALLGLSNFIEALEYYLELVTFNRLQRRARKGVLECLVKLNRWQDILKYLGNWAMNEEESINYHIKALCGLNQVDEAIAACKRWLQIKPHNRQALWQLTELELKKDGIETTIKKFSRMAKMNSLPPIYKEIYASLCRRLGCEDKAKEVYKKIDDAGSTFGIQKKHAFTLAKTGEEDKAIQIFEELLRIAPQDNYMHASYTAACKRTGQLERAINYYNKLLLIFPDQKSLFGRIKRLTNTLLENR